MDLVQLKLEKIRRAAYNDLFYFLRAVLGYPDIEEQPHREVCDFITKEPDLLEWFKMTPTERANNYLYIKKLLMLPRGHLKSTIATIGFPQWALWHDPTLRILIDNEVVKNSKRFLAECKENIQNPRVKDILTVEGKYPLTPDYDRPGGWTEDSVILKGHTTKEPSIATAGVDTAVTSQHYDIIIMDDLVSERNVTTPEQMAKVEQHYQMAYSLLEPGGLLIVIGTRYHLDDLYKTLLADDTFQTLVRPAIDEEGNVLFPKKFSKERLEHLKKSQGTNFYSQYMLTPIGGEDTLFRSEDIKVFDDLRDVPGNVYTFITVDLAVSKKQTADYTVLMVLQVDADGNIYAVDMRRGRFTPVETIQHLFELQRRWEPFDVGVEAVAFQKSMIYFIQDKMRETGNYFPLRELKADKDKIRRAKAFQPYVLQGMFHVYKPISEPIIDELVSFPYAKHDDIVDAISYVLQIMRKPPKKRRKHTVTVHEPQNAITGY